MIDSDDEITEFNENECVECYEMWQETTSLDSLCRLQGVITQGLYTVQQVLLCGGRKEIKK